MRVLLVRSLLTLVGPLLRLVPSLLILIRPLLVLIRPLLIPVLPLILRTVLPGLELGIAEPPHCRATIGSALAGNRNRGQKKKRAEKQDRSGDCRRTHSFRVGIPVHKTIPELAPCWLRAGASWR